MSRDRHNLNALPAGASRFCERPLVFVFGSALVVAGVLAHLPPYVAAADMDYRLAGMSTTPLMWLGMGLILAGLAVAASGLFPSGRCVASSPVAHRLAVPEQPLSARHIALAVVLAVALVVDVMKPATLAFIIPGSSEEYGLSKPEVALFPMLGLIGTAIGSLVWGLLGDRLGRRGSILLAALVFVATAVCGVMPAFALNLVMCFLMGLAAGGMLPLVFTLLAETIPTRQRGWLAVLIGGVGGIGGYLAASGAATLLEPRSGGGCCGC